MKKNIIKLVLSAFVFVSIISIATKVLALTASDISMLLNDGVISQAQATALTNYIASSVISTIITSTKTEDQTIFTDCADIKVSLKYTQKDTVANGYAVSVLQAFLKNNGYLQVTPTGYFGISTLSAVKNFQAAQGLGVDGVVGQNTRTIIKNLDCGYTNVGATISSTTSPLTNKTDAFAPIITLSANPAQVKVGQPTTLKWSSNNAVNQCKINAKDSSGNTLTSTIDSSSIKSSGPINKTTTYTIICYNKYGIPGSQSVIVKVISTTTAVSTQKYIHAPTIISIVPLSANRGDTITIKGSDFISTNDIVFDGAKIDKNLMLSQSSTSISFKIPEYKTCLSASCALPTVDTNIETGGKKVIQVSNINGFSNDFIFTIPSKIITIKGTPTATPYTPPKLTISSINPTSGNRGDAVTIFGTGFSSDSIVLFGGFKVADNLIISKTNNSISFIIPPFQLGCSEPEYEMCPALPLPGTKFTAETGGIRSVIVMNTSSKITSSSTRFTLPSKKVSY